MAADADAATLRKDVESMQATIKHLQNALDAKSMTIGILSKSNREGGDLESHITNAIQTKYAAILKAKDDEIQLLANKAAKASEARPSVAMQEVREALQKSLNEYRDRCKVLEKDKKELAKQLAEHKESLANVAKDREKALKEQREQLEREHSADAKALETWKGVVTTLEAERETLKRTQEELLESLQQERAELEKAQGGSISKGPDPEALARLEAELAEARKMAEDAQLRADAAELRASSSANSAETERRLEEEKKKSSELASQMRDYQMKAFELKTENDALSQQLEGLQEEMSQELDEKQQELDEVQKELSVLQADRDSHLRIAKEQIDSTVQAIRRSSQTDFQGQLAELAQERANTHQQVKELTEEAEKLRLKCDAQQAELKALREAVGETDCKEQALSQEKLAEIQAAPEEVKEAKREKARSLRELSKFAFDEMSERMAEQRAELEGEKKKLQTDFEQKMAERSKKIVELTNSSDSLQTQVETLERARDSLAQQRDELGKEIREKDRTASEYEARVEEFEKDQRELRDQLGCFRLVYALHRGVVSPAFQILTQSLRFPEVPMTNLDVTGDRSFKDATDKDADSVVDASTIDGDIIEEGDEEEEEDDDEEEEDEDTYGLDQNGQEEWAEMLEANTLDALFAGTAAAADNLSVAGDDMQEHVQNIVASLDMFPAMYAEQLTLLDRTGKGKDLRRFITIMQRAMSRLQRIAAAISELCQRQEDASEKLQNCIRVKGLEWHLRGLRAAGQHEILLRLQRNQLSKLKNDYEDVLDQYGEQCAQTSELEGKVKDFEAKTKELEKEIEELRSKAQAAPESAPAAKAAPKSMADIHQMMDDIARTTIEQTTPPAPKKGKGKGPPPPGAKAGSEAEAPAEQPSTEAPAARVPAKGPGKGKKGPPLPGQGPPPPAPSEAPAEPEPAVQEQPAAPKPAAKGKGKAKGPPLPGQGPPPPEPTAAPPEPEPAAAPAPAKGPGKGKKGPPTPGAKAAAEAAGEAAAPAPSGGKGPPPPGGKGPPPPGGKGPPPPGGKGPPPPGGKGPPPPGGKGPPAPGGKGPPAPGGKGPGGPAAPAGKAGKAGPGGKGKGKNALPAVDPGPEPPKDLAPKKFHWAGIQGNRFATSIFARLLEDQAPAEEAPVDKPKLKKVKVNLDFLTSYFFQKKKDDTKPDAAKSSAKKKTVATCLDSKRSQAVEIFLNGAGVKLDQVKSALVDLDEKALEVENLQKVLEFYPTAEEIPTLKEFQQDNDPKVLPWGRGEEFLISLMTIQDFKVRGECCQARGQFGEEFEGIAQDVITVKDCLSSLTSSTALPAIFAMVMQIGNYMNFGTNKGAQRGFSLDSLQVMTRVEGFNDKTYTLMRFIMDSLEGDRAVRDGALEDMKLCEASSKIDVDDAVARMGKLEGAINQVSNYVQPAEGDPKVKDDKFNSIMSDFVNFAKGKLTRLKEQAAEVADLTKQCCDLFAEKPKTPSGEFLTKFAGFRKDMEDARRQNLLAKAKKEKADKKRAEKENDPKKDNAKKDEAAKAKAKAKAAPAPATMRKMKVTNPDLPVLSCAKSKRSCGAENKARTHNKESSSGLMLRGAEVAEDGGRRTVGPLSRAGLLAGGDNNKDGRPSLQPDAGRPSLQVSLSGRISIGLAKASGSSQAISKDDIKALLKGCEAVQARRAQAEGGAGASDKAPPS